MNLRKNLDTTHHMANIEQNIFIKARYYQHFQNYDKSKYRVKASLYCHKTIRPSDFTAAGLFL